MTDLTPPDPADVVHQALVRCDPATAVSWWTARLGVVSGLLDVRVRPWHVVTRSE